MARLDGKEVAAGEWFRMMGGLGLRAIDIGIDRISPVSWDLYERHGNFCYTGTLHTVTLTPGPPVPGRDPEQLRQQLLEEARKLD